MDSAVNNLADAVKDLSQQLTRNIPKQYGQVVKEYASNHLVNLIFDICWLIVFLVLLVILGKMSYKYIRLYIVGDITEKEQTISWYLVPLILIAIMFLIFIVFSLRQELRRVIAPNYNMLYDILYDIIDATKN